ncbi:MAG: hypothetical protein WCO29_18780 [Nostocales cyanobacterium ELA583]
MNYLQVVFFVKLMIVLLLKLRFAWFQRKRSSKLKFLHYKDFAIPCLVHGLMPKREIGRISDRLGSSGIGIHTAEVQRTRTILGQRATGPMTPLTYPFVSFLCD